MKNKPDIAFEASSGNVFSGSVKGVAHLEGSGQEGIVHHPLHRVRTGNSVRSCRPSPCQA